MTVLRFGEAHERHPELMRDRSARGGAAANIARRKVDTEVRPAVTALALAVLRLTRMVGDEPVTDPVARREIGTAIEALRGLLGEAT